MVVTGKSISIISGDAETVGTEKSSSTWKKSFSVVQQLPSSQQVSASEKMEVETQKSPQ